MAATVLCTSLVQSLGACYLFLAQALVLLWLLLCKAELHLLELLAHASGRQTQTGCSRSTLNSVTESPPGKHMPHLYKQDMA
jgi:hypothetical protein